MSESQRATGSARPRPQTLAVGAEVDAVPSTQ